MKNQSSEFLTSFEDVKETAEFFTKLAHSLEKEDLHYGDNLDKFIEKSKMNIPGSLSGYEISLSKDLKLSKDALLNNTIVVQLPPREIVQPRLRIKKCFDMKKGPVTLKVCVDCSVSWTSLRCEISITIVAKL